MTNCSYNSLTSALATPWDTSDWNNARTISSSSLTNNAFIPSLSFYRNSKWQQRSREHQHTQLTNNMYMYIHCLFTWQSQGTEVRHGDCQGSSNWKTWSPQNECVEEDLRTEQTEKIKQENWKATLEEMNTVRQLRKSLLERWREQGEEED